MKNENVLKMEHLYIKKAAIKITALVKFFHFPGFAVIISCFISSSCIHIHPHRNSNDLVAIIKRY